MDGGDGRQLRSKVEVPIPTYEEATSRPSSSARLARGTTVASNAPEAEAFLGSNRDGRRNKYRPPTVESPRTSLESEDSADLSVPDMADDDLDERRHLEELDYLEPGQSEAGDRRQARLYHRARLRGKFTQHLSNLSATFSALRILSFRALYTPVASGPDAAPIAPSRNTWLTRVRDRVRVPERYRISASTFARLCGLFTIVTLVWLLFAMDFFPSAMRHRNMMASMFDPAGVRQYVQDHISAPSIQAYAHHLSSYAHVAGSEGDYFLARWMEERWQTESELDEQALLSQYVFVNYPNEDGRSIRVIQPDAKKWTASLEEDAVYTEEVDRAQTLTWHGYSASGNSQGPLIFANGGSRDDFRALHQSGIVTNGTIALVRMDRDHPPRNAALKVRFAQEAGCIGVLVFNGDSVSTAAGDGFWPETPMAPQDSVHRSNVAMANWILGDPLVLGRGQTSDTVRDLIDQHPGLPTIPSLPISWRDATVLLQKLDGHGVKVAADWLSGGGYTGNGTVPDPVRPDTVVVSLQNENDANEQQQVWNLHGMIQGAEAPEKKLLLGANRDSWCFGGVSSASGSAILMEMVNIFGELRTVVGWRPLRTIQFSSWDAGMWNSAGSTAFVEDNVDFLRANGIAYLNVGNGISGADLFAAGSPLLQTALQHALDRVSGFGDNVTLKEQFDSGSAPKRVTPLRPLGADGDFAPFAHLAGVPSLDIGFSAEQGDWVRGSCYDTFEWLEKFGDGADEMGYHHRLAQVWALVALDIVSAPLLPLDVRPYADVIGNWVGDLQMQADAEFAANGPGGTLADAGFSLEPLFAAADALRNDAETFHAFEEEWTTHVLAQGGLEGHYYGQRRTKWNDRISNFEASLLDGPDAGVEALFPDAVAAGINDTGRGLEGRPQFKHSLFAPEKWGDGVQVFPTVWERIEERKWEEAGKEARRVAGIIQRAGQMLVHVEDEDEEN